MPDRYETDPLYRLFAERLADLNKELERVFSRTASREGLDTVRAEQATVRAKVEELERLAGDLKPMLALASANAQRISDIEKQVSAVPGLKDQAGDNKRRLDVIEPMIWKWAGGAMLAGGGAGFGLVKLFGGGG